jgi:peptidoglycan hydrolase-like amidase
MKKWGIFICLVVGAWFLVLRPALADEDCKVYENNSGDYARCLGTQIDRLQKDLQSLKAATAPLESEVNKLEKQIASLQSQIKKAEEKRKSIESSIGKREGDLALQYSLLASKTREYYKSLRSRSTLTLLLSSLESGEVARQIGYRETVTNQNRGLILSISNEISQLTKDKLDLVKSKENLSRLQSSLDKQAEFFRKEIAGAKAYESVLTGKIASLSTLQQSLLSGKGDTFQTTVGDVPLADDPNSRPDYNPGFSPAFAAFSFGAPHFKGMSQYGAYGRAKSGQSAEDILKAYYSGVEIKKDYDPGKQISVAGFGRMDIETYVKRIYEMPSSWGDNGGFEALKAQAVAARSYALAWTNQGNGGAICTTESCQVYKNANKGGKWDEAVNATRGWVLWANGKPVKAWYASTSGGYILGYNDSYSGYSTSGFWDAVGGRSGWTGQAYEKVSGSPWFYKGWYKDRSGATCGRSHPWLNSEEMADILNAWVALHNGGDSSRVIPVDLSSCWGKSGSPYSMAELREKGGFTAVSGVTVSYSSNGVTDSLRFSTNKGDVTINGSEFKEAFNLRAPGRIALKSGLFNIEKK